MSDIFGGVEVPRWLQEATRVQEHGQWGQVAGLGLAAFTRMLSKEPATDAQGGTVTDPKTGQPLMEHPSFLKAYSESRMSLADPLWQLHLNQENLAMKQTQAQIANQAAQAKWHMAVADIQGQKASAWAHDAEEMAKWRQSNGTYTPDFLSVEANRMYSTDQYRQRLDALKEKDLDLKIGKIEQAQKEQDFKVDLANRQLDEKIRESNATIAQREEAVKAREREAGAQITSREKIAAEGNAARQAAFEARSDIQILRKRQDAIDKPWLDPDAAGNVARALAIPDKKRSDYQKSIIAGYDASQKKIKDIDDKIDKLRAEEEKKAKPTVPPAAPSPGTNAPSAAATSNIPKVSSLSQANQLIKQAEQAVKDGADPRAVRSKLEEILRASGYELAAPINPDPSTDITKADFLEEMKNAANR